MPKFTQVVVVVGFELQGTERQGCRYRRVTQAGTQPGELRFAGPHLEEEPFPTLGL